MIPTVSASIWMDLWPLLAIGALVLVVWIVERIRRRREREAAEGPFLIFPAPGAPRMERPLPLVDPAPPPPPLPAPAAYPSPAGTGGADAGSPTMRFEPAEFDLGVENTVQLLPGRLEVVYGTEAGPEFRFIRTRGQEVPEITLGRGHGPEFRHIRIPESTVSRLHARMTFCGTGWSLTNLSHTNPARVNGRDLTPERDTVALSDGDRIEMGQVELRYRAMPG